MEARSSPESFIAWPAAARAYWVNRSVLLISFLSSDPLASKFFTSQAKRVLNREASNLVMGPAPLLPATRLFQKDWTSLPRGVIAPRPVTTTFFILGAKLLTYPLV